MDLDPQHLSRPVGRRVPGVLAFRSFCQWNNSAAAWIDYGAFRPSLACTRVLRLKRRLVLSGVPLSTFSRCPLHRDPCVHCHPRGVQPLEGTACCAVWCSEFDDGLVLLTTSMFICGRLSIDKIWRERPEGSTFARSQSQGAKDKDIALSAPRDLRVSSSPSYLIGIHCPVSPGTFMEHLIIVF